LSPTEIQDRTRKALPGWDDSNFYQVCNRAVNLCAPEGKRTLKDILENHKTNGANPEVLVFDPWQEFIAGFDENNFKEISGATKFIGSLIDEHRLTVFLVMHTGKDPAKGARGHSILAGWRDTLISLYRKGNQDCVTVTVDPRWARPVPPFSLKFERGTVWPSGSSVPRFARQAERIRQIVADNGGQLTKDEVGRKLGLKREAAQKALKRAQDCGAIQVSGDVVMLSPFPEN
jgi:hypothetical protein